MKQSDVSGRFKKFWRKTFRKRDKAVPESTSSLPMLTSRDYEPSFREFTPSIKSSSQTSHFLSLNGALTAPPQRQPNGESGPEICSKSVECPSTGSLWEPGTGKFYEFSDEVHSSVTHLIDVTHNS